MERELEEKNGDLYKEEIGTKQEEEHPLEERSDFDDSDSILCT